MIRRCALVLPALFALLGLPAGTAAQIDPFYLDLERDAEGAAERGDLPTAARLYRIACFGMLDEPARLAACTVRLALAQGAEKDREGFEGSFGRLAIVEERFQGFTLAPLSTEERASFARLAAALLPPETIAAIPTVAAMARSQRENARANEAPVTTGRRRRAEAESTPRVDETAIVEAAPNRSEAPTPAAEAESSEPHAEPGTDTPSEGPPALDSGQAVPAGLPEADETRVAEARALASGQPDLASILGALPSLVEIADRHAERADLARLVGDLAYRAGQWPLCSEYFTRAGDPGPEAPLDRFYMAVCLYETGRAEEAAQLLAPSADRLKRSPFVESYLARILGPSTLP